MKIQLNPCNDLGIAPEFEINALDLAEAHFFKKKVSSGDYRQRALDLCIDSKVAFTSTCNSLRNLVDDLTLAIHCPYCENKVYLVVGGGSGSAAHLVAYCDSCKAEVHMSMRWDGIDVVPPP